MVTLKDISLFKIIRNYRFFIAGVVTLLIAYGVIVVFKKNVSRDESELLVVKKIDFDRFVLKNGLEVIIHTDSTAPVVSLNTSYRVGSRNEHSGKTGLAHLMEHLLLEGAALRDLNLKSEVERLGAWDYNGATDRDRTRLYMTVPKPAFDAALWVESERMGRLADGLSAEALNQARQIVLNELKRNQSGFALAFDTAVTNAMFSQGHPYSHLPGGSPEDIASVTLDDVRQWIKEHYKPNNATLVIAGDVDATAARNRIKTYFGSIPGGLRQQQYSAWIPKQETLHRCVDTSIPAGALTLVWAVPGPGSPDLDYLDLARHALETRLIQHLVLETRTARSVRIDLKPNQLCSLLVMMIEISTNGTESAILSDVQRILAEITRNGPEKSELAKTKQNILASLLFASERVGGPTGKAEILASAAVIAGGPDEFNITVDRIGEASAKDVATAVGNWLSLQNVTLLTRESEGGEGASATLTSDRPQSMPDISETDYRVDMASEQIKLSNDLTVLHAKSVSPISSVKIVWRRSPFATVRDELLSKAILDLLSEGTSDQLASNIQRELSELSSKLVLDNTATYFAIGLDFPSQNIDQALKTLSGMVSNARFTESHAATIRRKWERQLVKGEPQSWKAYLSTLLRLKSTGQLKEVSEAGCNNLTSLTAADIQNAYDTLFSPSNAALIVVGNVTDELLNKKIAQLFGSWHGANSQTAKAVWPQVMKNSGDAVYIVDRPKTDYVIIFAGLVMPSEARPDTSSMDIISRVLDSRLSKTFREKTQISYETFAGNWVWQQDGMVFAYADTSIEKVPTAITLLKQDFQSFGNTDAFCENEFKQAYAASTKRYLQAFESTESLMNFLVPSLIAAWPESQSGSVNCNEVLSLSRNLASYPALTWLILGDSEKLAPRLQRLGYKTEIIRGICWSSMY